MSALLSFLTHPGTLTAGSLLATALAAGGLSAWADNRRTQARQKAQMDEEREAVSAVAEMARQREEPNANVSENAVAGEDEAGTYSDTVAVGESVRVVLIDQEEGGKGNGPKFQYVPAATFADPNSLLGTSLRKCRHVFGRKGQGKSGLIILKLAEHVYGTVNALGFGRVWYAGKTDAPSLLNDPWATQPGPVLFSLERQEDDEDASSAPDKRD